MAVSAPASFRKWLRRGKGKRRRGEGEEGGETNLHVVSTNTNGVEVRHFVRGVSHDVSNDSGEKDCEKKDGGEERGEKRTARKREKPHRMRWRVNEGVSYHKFL